MIKMTERKSSNIAATGYDPSTRILAIRFAGSGDKVHQYRDVPPDVAAKFDTAQSVGRYFFSAIKGQYEHTVVLDSEAEAAQQAPRADVDGEEGLADFSANEQSARA